MSRDSAVVLDMIRAARLALEFSTGLAKDAFTTDLKTQSAVLHQLLVLGEAAKRISDSFRTEHPEIEWKPIAGMRDKVIHDYDDVDVEQVWRTVTNDLPALLVKLRALGIPESE